MQANGGEPLILQLRANPNYQISTLDRLILHEGGWPGAREIAFEHLALRRVALQTGDAVQVTLPDGKQRELRVAGFVEDRTTDSTSGNIVGYVTLDTLEYLGRPRSLNLIEFTAAEQQGSWRAVVVVLSLVASTIPARHLPAHHPGGAGLRIAASSSWDRRTHGFQLRGARIVRITAATDDKDGTNYAATLAAIRAICVQTTVEAFGGALYLNLKLARCVVPSTNITVSCRHVPAQALSVFHL